MLAIARSKNSPGCSRKSALAAAEVATRDRGRPAIDRAASSCPSRAASRATSSARGVGMTPLGDVIGVLERRKRNVGGPVGVRPLGGLRRLDDVHARNRLRRMRDAPEVLVDPGVGLRRIEIADDDQHRVVRPVVGRVKSDHVVERRRAQVLRIADHAATVRVHRVRFAIHQFVEHPVRLGQNALIVLADHDVALGVEVLLGDGQRAQAVGFGPQQRLEIVRRHDLVVVGDVVGGERVVEPADVLGEPVDRLGPGVLRPLEHQVLEEVREARATRRIVLAADAIADVDRDRRDAMILHEQHAQAVGQASVVELDRWDGWGVRTQGSTFRGGSCRWVSVRIPHANRGALTCRLAT